LRQTPRARPSQHSLRSCCARPPCARLWERLTTLAKGGIMSTWRTLGSSLSILAIGCSAQSPDPLPHDTDPNPRSQAADPVASACAHEDEDEDGAEVREDAAQGVWWADPKHDGKHETVGLKILGFNDFHGQLVEGRFVGGRPVGGAAVLASY